MEVLSEYAPLRAIENTQVTKTKKNDDPDRRLSVERIYQKKTQLEHILLRPDTYIGSVEPVTQQMWVFDEEVGMNSREVTFVPGLYKIFDEILVNAADNKQRDKNMSCIKINIDPENNTISVWNNGKGIPVVEHKVEKVYVPALIFGQLLTSSNYDDEQKKVTGGRNGYGAKLCNIFSNKFTVETACREYKKQFKQTWSNNMANAGESKLTFFNGEDYTCITFQPDLSKFKMQILDKDIVALMSRRAYDIAGASKGVKVFLNGVKLSISGFRSYVDQYVKDKVDETGNPLQIIHEVVNDRWEVCLTMSEKGFQQISFVNSIATTKGGRHVDFVADQIITKLIEVVKRKNKGGIAVKPFQVKNHMWLFVNALIENPTFDSQTKENMTLQSKSFGSKCPLSEKFVKAAVNCGIVESILNWVKFKAQNQLNKKCSAVKHTKIKGIPKLDDANDAGSKFSQQCTLILTEGDSAKTLAVSGLGVVGRDRYGVFPLKGKMLNVREASHKQIMENAEINNVIKIMGLQYKKKYDDDESLRTLRYGKLMIMTDQDQDGSHIKGLLINFIHHNWPSLLRHKFLEEFITPIVKVSKNKQEMSFYSIPEFEEWKNNTDSQKSWKVKYYKGLGTSTAKEAKEYFADMNRHRIPFKYAGPEDDAAISLAFSKKQCDDRKEWLTNFMVDRRQRRLLGLPEDYLYGSATKQLTYNEFINKELILFSNSDNERSIPSLVDGLKPGQRKVLFTCFKRNDKREVKVAQLAGSVAEMSAYHHGENSLMSTIINLAQNFVGSNNINLLQPIGQFGTRLHGGKDAASPRYIFTMLSQLARLLFPAMDDHVLKFICDDNQRVEPEWYIPIIPMVLINGAEGIGTGWACKIPNYDVREVVNNIRRMLDGDEPLPMLPNYKNFKGVIQELGPSQYVVNGEVSVINETTLEITELPARTWTQTYKEQVLDPMCNGTEKTAPLIQDYREYHTDTTVRYVVTMTEQKLAEAEAAGLHKIFKLQTNLTCNSMVLFDHVGCLRKYETVMEIIKEFFDLRLQYYTLRKEWQVGMLTAEASKLTNQARFILEKIEGKIVIENKPKKELIQVLVDRGYDSDPVKAWKALQDKDEPEENEEEAETATSTSGPDFNYLLNMPMWYLTKEKKDELCKQRDTKETELMNLKKKSTADLWKDDLAAFIEQLDIVEAKEREDDASGIPAKGQKGKGGKPRKAVLAEIMPSPHGRRIVPRVTTAMKAEATKKVKKRVKDDGVAVKIEFGEDDGGSPAQGESENLAARLAKKDNAEGESENLAARLAKKGKAEGGAKGGKGKKQAMLPFKPIKKRSPWSDSENDDDDEAEVEPPTHSERPERSSKPKKFVEFSDDDNEDIQPKRKSSELSDEDFAIDSDSATEVLPDPKPKVKKVRAPKVKVSLKDSVSASVDMPDDESVASPAQISMPAVEKPPPKKRAAPKKAAAIDKQQPSIMDALSKPKASKAKACKAMSLDLGAIAEKTGPKAMTSKAMSLDFDLNVEKPACKAMTSKAVSLDLDVDEEKTAPKSMSKAESLDLDVVKPAAKAKISKTASQDQNKKPAAKKNVQKPRKRKAFDSDSSGSDMDFGSKKSTAIKKNRNADDSFHVVLPSDSDSDAATPARKAPRALPGRAKKPVKYAFDSDEDTDDDMFC